MKGRPSTLIFLFFFFFVYGCASLPKSLQESPALRDVPFSYVKNNPEKYYDVSLLWGGKIINCKNTEEGTIFEMLYLPVDSQGYPIDTDAFTGRFIVKSKIFLDCAVYSNGRLLTVVGSFKGLKEGKIDEMPYSFPFLEAKAVHLWKKRYLYPYYRQPSFWFWYGHPRWWFEYCPW